METVKVMFLFFLIMNVVTIVCFVYTGRQLRKMRVLMEKGAEQISEYVAVVLSQDGYDEAVPAFVSEEEQQLAAEEKKMLFSFDPEPVLKEFMGDIL